MTFKLNFSLKPLSSKILVSGNHHYFSHSLHVAVDRWFIVYYSVSNVDLRALESTMLRDFCC